MKAEKLRREINVISQLTKLNLGVDLYAIKNIANNDDNHATTYKTKF